MKTKPLIYLAVILVVLVGLKFVQSTSHKKEVGRSGIEDIVADLQPTDISRISITGPGGKEIDIARDDVDWVVESSFHHPADTAKIDRIVEGIAGLKGEFRSKKESVLADYALDDEQAIHLRAEDLSGAERVHLLIGNRMTGSSGFFVRKEGDDTAFAAQGNLLGDLGVYGDNRDPDGKRFCNLKALQLDRKDIDQVTLVQGDDRLELVKAFAETAADSLPVDRSNYEWQVDGTPVKKTVADGIAGALTSIWARDVLDPGAEHGFEETQRWVEITLAAGETKRVEFGKVVTEPEAGLAMRIAGQGSVFLVPDNLPDRIFKTRDDLAPGN